MSRSKLIVFGILVVAIVMVATYVPQPTNTFEVPEGTQTSKFYFYLETQDKIVNTDAFCTFQNFTGGFEKQGKAGNDIFISEDEYPIGLPLTLSIYYNGILKTEVIELTGARIWDGSPKYYGEIYIGTSNT